MFCNNIVFVGKESIKYSLEFLLLYFSRLDRLLYHFLFVLLLTKDFIMIEIYHGSNVRVENPRIQVSSYSKDFGYGFYCTVLPKQAQRWALTKHPKHIVSVYEYIGGEGLNVKSFSEMTDEWLDFVVNCRRGVEHHYDVVEGPMADDQIWDYVEDLANDRISREAFWALVKFRYPTHQIVFCTDKALEKVKFKSSYSL